MLVYWSVCLLWMDAGDHGVLGVTTATGSSLRAPYTLQTRGHEARNEYLETKCGAQQLSGKTSVLTPETSKCHVRFEIHLLRHMKRRSHSNRSPACVNIVRIKISLTCCVPARSARARSMGLRFSLSGRKCCTRSSESCWGLSAC